MMQQGIEIDIENNSAKDYQLSKFSYYNFKRRTINFLDKQRTCYVLHHKYDAVTTMFSKIKRFNYTKNVQATSVHIKSLRFITISKQLQENQSQYSSKRKQLHNLHLNDNPKGNLLNRIHSPKHIPKLNQSPVSPQSP